MLTRAKVIADSISHAGHRLTTMEVTLHRFVLAEFNTHRVFSRNSASSRAIPVEKSLDRVVKNPAMPLVWPAEQPGMQGGSDLQGDDLLDAYKLFHDVHRLVTNEVDAYLTNHHDKSSRLHKSLINRLLEPFMWHTIVVTSTEWQNFFDQRCHPDAQPEIRVAAEMMQRAYNENLPKQLGIGEWHLPYIDLQDLADAAMLGDYIEIAKRMSVARCARVSTLNHDGKRSIDDDLKLYDRLTTAQPPHASPLEHVATPIPFVGLVPLISQKGNFTGWTQLRHQVLGL